MRPENIENFEPNASVKLSIGDKILYCHIDENLACSNEIIQPPQTPPSPPKSNNLSLILF